MPSRLPVTSGIVPNLRETNKESITAQVLPGDNITKEKLIAMSHGVMRADDQASSDSDERGSDYMANPLRWENNAARKQLDMQWHYTCGPLRVSTHTGKNHWNRLHSSNVAVIPQPGGGAHIMTSNILHRSDKDLEAQAAKIGGARGSLKRMQGLPPLYQPNPPSTPLMRQFLKETTMPPVPKRATSSVVTDGSSAFSRTTIAGSRKSTHQKNDADVASAVGSDKNGNLRASSLVGRQSQVSKVSKVSQQSRQSAASSIKVDLERERTMQRDLASELRVAAQNLAMIEAFLQE